MISIRRFQKFPTARLLIFAPAILLLCQYTLLAQDKSAKIQEVLALAHKYRQFNGTALVAENGKVIYKTKEYAAPHLDFTEVDAEMFEALKSFNCY